MLSREGYDGCQQWNGWLQCVVQGLDLRDDDDNEDGGARYLDLGMAVDS